LSAHYDRTIPLNDDQKALVHKLPAEFSKVRHVRGILSMAREDKDPDSGETSFSILLGPAPHLDGKYTVFGHVEGGDAVLDEMLRVPRGEMKRPIVRIEVTRAEVVSSSALAAMRLVPATAIPLPAGASAAAAAAVVGSSVAGAATSSASPS